MHGHQWHESNKLISNYSQRALLCLFSKHKYVNGICEPHMDNCDDMNER